MRKKLIASPGCVITNGEIYGKAVDLAECENGEGWYEITEEEYAEILSKEMAEHDT